MTTCCCSLSQAKGDFEAAKGSIGMRCITPLEFEDQQERSGTKLDYTWYLTNQVLPPIARLCEVIEGTDAGQIADCLGLDSTKFREIVMARKGDDGDGGPSRPFAPSFFVLGLPHVTLIEL